MPYVIPEEVVSPKSRFGGLIEVIYSGEANEMSVARILWDDDERIACRWNGNDEHPKGNPLSRGQATWFVVDEYAAPAIEQAAREAAERSPNSLVTKYREMARDSEREREAQEWTEGLIGDEPTPR